MGYAEQEAEPMLSQQRAYQSGANEGFRTGQIETLNFAMRLCGSGMTPAMIRILLHNKLVEITGEGEKA